MIDCRLRCLSSNLPRLDFIFQKVKMDIGAQYLPDDKFKAKARLFQSRYRAEVLGVEYQDYGNRLTDSDAETLLNYYSKLNSRTILRKRYPNYSRRRDADLLRSEHIPFNLLAPLSTDLAVAVKIISKLWNIDCVSIQTIEIEYAPSPREIYLNDGTAFDAYFRVLLKNGNVCGIGIEVKYTEQAYSIGKIESVNIRNHDSLYWQTARASGVFRNPSDPIFGSDRLRQIWRNHLLGLKMIQAGDIDEFYSIIVFPDANKHFNHVISEYTSLLEYESRPRLIGCTFEKFISAISGSPDFEEWKGWLSRRYIG